MRRSHHLGTMGAASHAQTRAHGVPGIFRSGPGCHSQHRRNQKRYLEDPRQAVPRGHPGRDSSIWTSATFAPSATAPSPSAGLCRRWCCLGDIVGEDDAVVAAATSEVVRLANARSGEGFIAVSSEARKKFWLDRARTAAIAKHTNAFKINEDVVIPLERLGEYTDSVERINIELSIQNKLATRRTRWRTYFCGRAQAQAAESDAERTAAARAISIARVANALALPARIAWTRRSMPSVRIRLGNRSGWRTLGVAPSISAAGTLLERLQDRSIRVSWKTELRAELARIFVGATRSPPFSPSATPFTGGYCRDGCSSRCTCMPVTATCTPTFP